MPALEQIPWVEETTTLGAKLLQSEGERGPRTGHHTVAGGTSEEGTQPRLRWGAEQGTQRRLARLPLGHANMICGTNRQ